MMPSFKLVFYLASYFLQAYVFAAPQDDTATALPAAESDLGGPQNEDPGCGTCFVVADVDAVVWYSEIFLNVAATKVLNVAIGNNTRTTRTSTIINEATFTIEPNPDNGDGNSGLALTTANFASTLDIGNAKLFSPTAYNVFRAYTIGSAYESEGSCVTVTNAPSTLATAFSEQIPQASSAVYLNEDGQQRFLDYLQLTGCSAGGQKVTPIVVAQVQNSTLEITQYQTGGALASATRTLGPTSNAVSTSTIGVTTLTQIVRTVSVRLPSASKPTPIPVTIPISRYYPSVRAPLIVIGSSTTITPKPNPLPLPIAKGTVITNPAGGGGGGAVGSITVEVVVPSGEPGGGNFTTVAIVPYISRGNTWRKAGSSWVELSVAGAVGLCCAVLLYL